MPTPLFSASFLILSASFSPFNASRDTPFRAAFCSRAFFRIHAASARQMQIYLR
jgi:hypothetical protein